MTAVPFNTTPRDTMYQRISEISELLERARDGLTNLKGLAEAHLAGPTMVHHRTLYSSLVRNIDQIEQRTTMDMHSLIDVRDRFNEVVNKLANDEHRQYADGGLISPGTVNIRVGDAVANAIHQRSRPPVYQDIGSNGASRG